LRKIAISAIALALWIPVGVLASQLDEVMAAGEKGANYVKLHPKLTQ
jgi:hypothetical protein